MNEFSSYLKQKKQIVKELVDNLSKEYEFVSVLGTDVTGKNYMKDFKMGLINPSSIEECGFVLRVYKDHKYYEYSFNEINNKSIDNIINIVNQMINKNKGIDDINAKCIKEESLVKSFKRNQEGSFLTDGQIINKLTDLVNYANKKDNKIINARASIEIVEISKMYISNKKELTQYYTWINPRTFVLVKNDSNMKYAYDGFGLNDLTKAFDLLKDSMDNTIKLANELLNASLPAPGKYTIITDPSITGLIAHEAFGHGLEMDQFVKDRAKGKEYMNSEVASKLVTMHDGAKPVLSSGSYFFDDEGTLAQDTIIINKGTLRSGICDAVSASILGINPTGNGRRESYKNKAYTRMTNTYFAKGNSKLEDMIKSVKYGYFISTTNNGMEDPKNWGIQCTALYGKEIVDGKFTGKIISPVVMSGYVIDLLESISEVASDSFDVIGSGSCGKGYKEWVRVADGGASIKAEVKIG